MTSVMTDLRGGVQKGKKGASLHAMGLDEYIIDRGNGVLSREAQVKRALGAVGLGYRYGGTYQVGREKVREFAAAVFNSHPAHFSEEYMENNGEIQLIASPTFVGILGIVAHRKLTDAFMADYDIGQIMQTEQRLEFPHPIYAGDELFIDVIFDSFREMAGADILVTRTVIYNQDDVHVLSSWTTLIARVVDSVNEEVEEALKGVMYSAREIV